MLVWVQLTNPGSRLAATGCNEIRGTTRDLSGETWSVRVQLSDVVDTETGAPGTATFLVPGVEAKFSQTFEVKLGRITYAWCTPLDDHHD